MKVKEILNQHRRDFTAIYECEHCGSTRKDSGYDDDHFHRNVIPSWVCEDCGKTSPESYRPLGTKYPEGKMV